MLSRAKGAPGLASTSMSSPCTSMRRCMICCWCVVSFWTGAFPLRRILPSAALRSAPGVVLMRKGDHGSAGLHACSRKSTVIALHIFFVNLLLHCCSCWLCIPPKAGVGIVLEVVQGKVVGDRFRAVPLGPGRPRQCVRHVPNECLLRHSCDVIGMTQNVGRHALDSKLLW